MTFGAAQWRGLLFPSGGIKMKLGDLGLGVIVLIVGTLLFFSSLQFSPLPGQKYGAETLPRVISFMAWAVGACLCFQGLKETGTARIASWADWANDPKIWVKLIAACLLVVVYIMVLDLVGFTIASTVLIVAMLILLGNAPLFSLITGIATVVVLQFAFGKLLYVPLPRGEFFSLPW